MRMTNQPTLLFIYFNNYGFQRIKINNFVYTFCMGKVVCFDSVKAIIVQTDANQCIIPILVIPVTHHLSCPLWPNLFGGFSCSLISCINSYWLQ